MANDLLLPLIKNQSDGNSGLSDIAFPSSFRDEVVAPISTKDDVISLLESRTALDSFIVKNVLALSTQYSSNLTKESNTTFFLSAESSADSPEANRLRALIFGKGGYKIGPEIPPSSLEEITPAISLSDLVYSLRCFNIDSVGAVVPNPFVRNGAYTWLLFWKPGVSA